MKRKFFYALRAVFALANLAAFCALFLAPESCGRLAALARFQFVPAVLACDAVALGVILVLTVLFGRFYCAAVCPLGCAQDVLRRIRHPKACVRRLCTRLPETPRQKGVRWAVFVLWLALGPLFGLVWLDPYAVFGRAALAGKTAFYACTTAPEMCAAPAPDPAFYIAACGLALVVAVLAFVGAGRIWCNWICPVGSVMNLLAKGKVAMRDQIGKGCGGCMKCK